MVEKLWKVAKWYQEKSNYKNRKGGKNHDLLVFQNGSKKFKKNKRSSNFLQSITFSGSLILTEPKDIKKRKLKWKEPKEHHFHHPTS